MGTLGILPVLREHKNQRSEVKTSCGGGWAFLPNFQESFFLTLNYTLGTNFVPNVLKKVLSVTRLMRYRPIKIIS